MSGTDHHPKAAPGELNHLRQLVNTLDLETHEDDLADPEALAAWLSERDLLTGDEPLTDADLRQAQAVREALRKLMLSNNGTPLEPGAAEALNAAAKSAELAVRFDPHGHASLAPVRSGFDGAVGRLLGIVYQAMAEGTWERMKACPAEDCEWAFYDWSKNRSGTWCNMASCGNRAKARNYRSRRRHGDASQAAG
jgi:predicted RNA-binding Zn ribbon-like protein